jgi:asparagine synthase (glutamine-hydrolysing)
MCGIAGIISTKPAAGNPKAWEKFPAAIHRMTNALAHRGPDAEGQYIDEHAALGHRRLSIIDLSPEANQPFWDLTERYAIVFNGEVYNFREIRSQLTDFRFRTGCDTEVILAAYITWGEECLHRFFGMFAFAVWDKKERKLFIARDRLGIKPLYYAHTSESFLFASEIRAILASGMVKKELSRQGLHNYLTYQTVHAPHTIVEGILQLNSGECATLQDGNFSKKTYWSLTGNEASREESDYDTVKKQVRKLLREAIERRLISDVPLGAFLSGGIDSSSVVALMAEVAGRQVDTFSVVFKEEQFDESPWSNMIARRFNTRHHPMLLEPTDFLDALPDALQAMDSPSGDGVNTYVVSKVTKQAGVTVALSGLGGDELFAGYSLFGDYLRLNRIPPFFWKIPGGIRRGGSALLHPFLKSHQRERVSEIFSARSACIEDVYPAFRKVLTRRELKGALFDRSVSNGNFAGRENDAVYQILKSQPGLKKLPLLSQLTVADISTYTQNVLLKDTDQMSMAHALEVRVPFFDHALVEYVVQIPDKWKYPDYAKKLLVESLEPLLPKEIVFRPKKGFDLPWKVWMKNELRGFCEQKLKKLGERDLIAPKLLDHLWSEFSAGKNDNLWSRVWIFAVLEDWLEKNLDT